MGWAIGMNSAAELYVLLFRLPRQGQLARKERRVRLCMAAVSLGFGVGFALLNQVYGRLTDLGMCCQDVWATPNSTNADLARLNSKNDTMMMDWNRQQRGQMVLVDTASNEGFVIKHLIYWSEVFSCLFFAFDLVAIWFFCKERQPLVSDALLMAEEYQSDSSE